MSQTAHLAQANLGIPLTGSVAMGFGVGFMKGLRALRQRSFRNTINRKYPNKDLIESPIEEAKAFKRYTAELGWGGESELARKISRSEQYISSRVQLLRLPREIVEVSNNKLKVSQALEIVNLDEKDQKIVNEAIVKENLTVRDIRNAKRLKIDNVKRGRKNDGEESPDIILRRCQIIQLPNTPKNRPCNKPKCYRKHSFALRFHCID